MGYASELGNYAEYSGAPNEEEVLQYARVVLDVRTTPELFSSLCCLLGYSNVHNVWICSVLLLILMVVRELFSSEGV